MRSAFYVALKNGDKVSKAWEGHHRLIPSFDTIKGSPFCHGFYNCEIAFFVERWYTLR